MECNKEEARRALDIAKKKVTENDYNGASKFVYKAQYLYPELDGLKQVSMMVNVYISASNGGGGEADWYGVLGVDPLADDVAVKKQYRKLALLLHPDKNKFHGAEGAFKLVSEAWCLLSDKVKRIAYDQMRKSKEVKPRKSRKQQKQPPKQKKQPPNQQPQPPNQKKQPPNQKKQPPNQQPQPPNQQSQAPNQQPQPPNKQSQAPNPQKQQPSTQKQPPNKQPSPQKQPPNKQPSPQKQPPNKQPSPQKQPPNKQPSPQKQPPNKQPSPQKQQPSPQKQPPNKQPQQPSPQKQQPNQQSSNGVGNGRARSKKRSSDSSSKQKIVGTFLTMCNKCGSEYEYLKAFYLNKTLLCRNCRGSFVATEKEKTPQATNKKDANGVSSTCGRDEEDATRGIGNADRGFKKLRTDDYAGSSCGIKV